MIYFMLWLALAAPATILIYKAIVENEEKEGDTFKLRCLLQTENVLMLAIGMFLPLLAYLGVAGAYGHSFYEDRKRLRARLILRKWEGVDINDKWCETYEDPTDHNGPILIDLLRDSSRSMKTEDLKFLAGLKDNVYQINKDIMNCILDELLERAIIGNERN